jgi:mono/diheme cytochrome c family protein
VEAFMRTIRAPRRVRARQASSALLLAAALAACGGGDQPAADTTATDTPPAGGAVAAGGATAGQGEGEQLYQRCVTCHQANGEGLAGSFPPLAGSEYATAANVAVPIRIVMHGMQGPLTVKGTQYNGIMPAGGTGIAMSDAEIAAVLTYVRQSWGNNASAVTAEQVAAERTATSGQSGPVTAEQLQPLMTGG